MNKEIINNAFYTFNWIVDDSTHKDLNDRDMLEAMTLVSELQNIGYTLSAEDVVALAHTDRVAVKEILNKHAELTKGYTPMYPDFPKQVMEMDEATFRFHQMVHYFSTYGMESLFGVECPNGWMPDVETTDKIKKDKKLLDYKVLELHSSKEYYEKLKIILSKKERLTATEAEMVANSISEINLDNIEIPFKENISVLFKEISNKNVNNQDGCKLMHNFLKDVCKHSGDVLDTLEKISKEKGKLRTSEKKAFAYALNDFNLSDIENNFAERKNTRYLLNAISYGNEKLFKTFYNKTNLDIAVNKLKNNELKSWRSRVEQEITNFKEKESTADDVLNVVGERPGELLRMSGRLFRIGVEDEMIKNKLIEASATTDFKIQTLLSNVTYFGQEYKNSLKSEQRMYSTRRHSPDKNETGNINRKENEFEFLYNLNRELLKEELKKVNTSLENKKVYINEQGFDFKNSLVNINEKAQEGGFLPSGIAIKIPENANTLRFFVFWNDDDKRVDLDMHAFGKTKEGDGLHVGWNGHYNQLGIVTSGDVTTSHNSAEYIDINMSKNEIDYLTASVNAFNVNSFDLVETAYCGATFVNNTDRDVSLYNPQNCFFHMDLTKSKERDVSLVDIFPNENFLRIASKTMTRDGREAHFIKKTKYTLDTYLEDLCVAKSIKVVNSIEDADVIISYSRLENPEKPNYCLIDNNLGLNETEEAKRLLAEEKNNEIYFDLENER